MKLKKIIENLFLPENVKKNLSMYINKTGNYNLLDHFDEHEFLPIFNRATTSISVFSLFNIKLDDLIEDYLLSDVLEEFEREQIGHNHKITIKHVDEKILVYYQEALNFFPKDYVFSLMSWKRTAEYAQSRMLPSRKNIWNNLWKNSLQFDFSYHPAIFLGMTRYKGPIVPFLQRVQKYLMVNLPNGSIEVLYNNCVCQTWTLKFSSFSLFISLWHQVMQESAIAYLPKPVTNINEYSIIDFKKNIKVYICNSDKFICLLLILFCNKYREKIDQILLHEPVAPILAEVFTRFPQLQ